MTKTLALAGALLLAGAGATLAHITLERAGAPAGSTYEAVLRVGHGCGDAPTTAVRVRIPEGVVAVEPLPKPGWTLETRLAPSSEPVASAGQALTEGVREISWSGGKLPDGRHDTFVFRGQLPKGEPGQVLYFPVVQECGDTAIRWIGIPAEGQTSEELEEPAPGVTLTAPVEGH